MGRKFEKAIILAAGMGKRLKGETQNVPKALVEVHGHSLLELILWNLSRFTGTRSVVLATGHFHGLVEEKIGSEYAGLKIGYLVNEDYESTNNCYTLWLLREHLADGFLLVNTDVLFDGRILEKAEASSYESFIVVDVLRILDEEDMKVRLENSRIVEISKELDPALSHGEYIGILGFGS
jgi:choline kinase